MGRAWYLAIWTTVKSTMRAPRPSERFPAYVRGVGMTVVMGAIWVAGAFVAAEGASPDAKKQIAAGITLYKNHCVKCHSENLAGGAGPALRGEDFLMQWDGKPMRALYSRILMTMPGDDPGSLTPAEVLTLVSYIASENSLANWKSPFKSANELGAITMRKPK
jgi:mono/diheme cytochrome c family protein